MDCKIGTWNIRGLGKLTKQNEVKKLIRNEQLSVCAVLETHLKKDRIGKICDRMFGNWSWQHNLDVSIKGCRIIVGWNSSCVQCHLVQSTRQTMLYLVEVIKTNVKFFCTFIYAANHGRDRKELWKDLNLYSRIVMNEGWVMMGDMNVILNNNEHSEGVSSATQDMKDFQECVNDIEMVDICSSGFQYTWTKSLLNPNATVLKKLDRVMCNSTFLTNHNFANAVFLPYGISDHSPAVLCCPGVIKKVHKSFRMANYITDKDEFGDIVKEVWKEDFQGYEMYKMVHKLKALKPHLNKLNWKNGNLFDKVEELRGKLHDVQTKIDKDPLNKTLRNEEVQIIGDYNSALQDEEKLLCQKARVDWLKEGDRNSAYFHKVLKGRINRSRIHTVMGNDGIVYEKEQVGVQFVKHFEGFLGMQASTVELNTEDIGLFCNKIDDQDANGMIKDVTNEEIKDALFDIDNNKAPGPDGFTAAFFKKAWEIVKIDFCNAVKEFFFIWKASRGNKCHSYHLNTQNPYSSQGH